MLRDRTKTQGFERAAAKPSLDGAFGAEDLVVERPETPVVVGLVRDVDEFLL
jgi:hypothetical protein